MRLSHSAKDTYIQCPFKYKLHYIDRKRSIRTSSALVFGSSLDTALNELLLTRNIAATELVFTEEWNKHKETYTIDFFKSDADASLLTLTQAQLIDAETDADKKWHKLCWYSLFQKGRAMLDAYNKEIMPRIVNVIKVQEEIHLQGEGDCGNPSEDTITGIIDVIAEVLTDDGEIVKAILDNKSTSQPYPKNSVLTKEQTALYSVAKPEIEFAGFATMNKKPPFKTQFLLGKPPEELKEATINRFVEIIELINANSFPKNKKSCFSFGQQCQYYSFCHRGYFNENIITKET